ncbi:L-threonine 3-dehydrogenase [Modestobacter italicus]|uniref:L-threonine 3-dehydrogenase n=1 Tax=Modestobacter italicus (strain DSM 44449 / CECT 9708 / BC 501) TaxID=2732864 RepID=I4F0X6_MODI5|nr:alcohol dehydrogenase catalytic domain-containing protein [Modestobacter marinus]CCH89289.1 L-threonine 3-dehydrogenase [Modestobacter marinus]
MKAVVCAPDAPEGTAVTDVPDPAPEPGEVVVEVNACGLCGSDVHAIEHGRTVEGQILGHEFGGHVVEVGPEARGWRVGQAVAVNPLGACGRCRACRKELPFRCTAAPNLGITAPGGYAEYVAVPADQLVAMPDGAPVEWGAHAEPLAVALRAVALAAVGPADSVLVYGVGAIGLNAIFALRAAGVESVVGAGRSPGRRHAAAAAGADIVLDTRAVSVREHVARTGRRFDAVLECSAAEGAVEESMDVLAPGGTCVVVALTSAAAKVPLGPLVGEGLGLVGSCAFRPIDFTAAVAHVTSGRLPVADLISERVGLQETPDALVRLRRPGDLVRVLTVPGADSRGPDPAG